ncbi:hypothetical protein SAMN04488112_107104 [Melghirimyces thermohalophilus]|uniref:Uncharacterized protein n=1 Tax=Melghirimyces thermohalophilus TaxID=1236220 RepID=A0A1G6L9U4_9BACL|nr:hypothetical protein SAMN04488112_107104 [Melghirimyces thermohalophilus]
MKCFKKWVVKFIMMTAVLWLVLGGLFGISFGTLFTTSVLLPVSLISSVTGLYCRDMVME